MLSTQHSVDTLPPMRTWFSSCFNFSAFILHLPTSTCTKYCLRAV